MKDTIKQYIVEECDKLIGRYSKNVHIQKDNQRRYRDRTGLEAGKPPSYIPTYWELLPLFNPFYVRSRADAIAYSISRKIRNGEYEPQPSLVMNIPKATGGIRQVAILQIPDSAVSLYLFKRLISRNIQSFSSYCYAYIPGRNAHHALEHLYSHVSDNQRQYVLEYDFSNFFGSISHEYLVNVIDRSLKVNQREMGLINSFLGLKHAPTIEGYTHGDFLSPPAGQGVPQGSSISLFLANVACLELDRELELQGAIFARYADDTIILCDDYNKANACANLMFNHGKRSMTEINIKKSSGISLLDFHNEAEMRTKANFEFLGHSISQTGISLSDRTTKRFKKRVSKIIYQHLLLYPRRHSLSSTRVNRNGTDWDMVTCINEIRRYIYGRISEEQITKCINDKSESLKLSRCALSFYPLVDDPEVFKELDGWLVSVLSRAQKTRKIILASQFPYYKLYPKEKLINGTWYKSRLRNETRLPSFFKSWQYVTKCLKVYGIQRFPNPPYSS